MISSYFNPAGYRRRRSNYAAFRRRLQAPLATVEASFDGRFELTEGAADILLQVQGGDVLWQKERLLNLALEVLPRDCDGVAWVDADVIFERDDWAGRTLAVLDRFPLAQVFSERHDLATAASDDQLESAPKCRVSRSVGSAIEAGAVDRSNLSVDDLSRMGLSIGAGWAARREILDRHGFYDACIVGGGDRAMVSAGLGAFGSAQQSLQMNARRSEHYLGWARPFFGSVAGSIGHVEGRLYHLWHGEFARRRYTTRDEILADFDPCRDIAIDGGGCWKWASEKPALHERVRRYFDQRMEDGAPAEEPVQQQ
ncbi:MAG: hypothetical protein GC160_09385 [Acidobacteria bacterium]|nr:hypothetical protein [Acidobacteriota bacterium]